jgi:hypothetical protein
VRVIDARSTAESRPSRRFRVDIDASALDGKATSMTGIAFEIATRDCQPLLSIILEAYPFVGIPIVLIPADRERLAPIVYRFHDIVDSEVTSNRSLEIRWDLSHGHIQTHFSTQSPISGFVESRPHEAIMNLAGSIDVYSSL